MSFPRRASEVIAPHELNFAVALNSTLEGKTDKQKNSHQEASLAWFVAGSAAGAVTSVTAPPALKPTIRMESIQNHEPRVEPQTKCVKLLAPHG